MPFLRSIPKMVVMAFSLLLLFYVGLGEGRRVYEGAQLKNLASQADQIRDLAEVFLRVGLKLEQFVGQLAGQGDTARFAGFSALTAPRGGGRGHGITLFDGAEPILTDGGTGACAERTEQYLSARRLHGSGSPPTVGGTPVALAPEVDYTICRTESHYLLELPLEAKAGTVGRLLMTLPAPEIDSLIAAEFGKLRNYAWELVLVFGLLATWVALRSGERRLFWLRAAYLAVFTVAAVLTLATLVTVYQKSADSQLLAIGDPLAERLRAIPEAGVPFEHVVGLPEILADARSRFEEIDDIALVRRGEILADADGTAAGSSWETDPNDYSKQFLVAPATTLIVAIPDSFVRRQIVRNVRNFSALFVACALLSYLLLDLAISFDTVGTVQRQRREEETIVGRLGEVTISSYVDEFQVLWLTLSQAIWFLTIFSEALSASFLPHYLQQMTQRAELPHFLTALLFSAFFAAFVAVLVPAGHFAEKREIKLLIVFGGALSALGLLGMALAGNVWALLASRLLGGAGQGIAFIGVQSYVMITAVSQRTQASARQVFAQNSGVISGAAIGSLLVIYRPERDVFLFGAAVLALTVVAVWWTLPRIGKKIRPPAPPQHLSAGQRLRAVATDFEFLRTFLLVGTSSKVVYNGVVFFSIPLLMQRMGLGSEEIGQALMLFAGAVLLANHYVAKLADKLGGVRAILLAGMLASGAGLLLVGCVDLDIELLGRLEAARTLAIYAGLVIIGLANGFIAAPVVSHVLDTRTVKLLGRTSALALYRLLERSGHVLGPLILSQLMLWTGQQAHAVAMVGLVAIVFGMLFFVFSRTGGRKHEVAVGDAEI
jgi:MFS family permease